MNKRRAVWLGLLGLGVGWEYHELRDERGYPLTWLFRWAFRTHHPIGRAVFVATFTWFAQWFVRHILADAVAMVEEVVQEIADASQPCEVDASRTRRGWRVR